MSRNKLTAKFSSSKKDIDCRYSTDNGKTQSKINNYILEEDLSFISDDETKSCYNLKMPFGNNQQLISFDSRTEKYKNNLCDSPTFAHTSIPIIGSKSA